MGSANKGKENKKEEETIHQIYNQEEKINFFIDSYNYHLPEHLIAQYPLEKRDEAKLFVYDFIEDKIEHTRFKFIYKYLKEGELLILNNTRVIPAKIFAKKQTGGRVEVLFLEKIDQSKFKALVKGKNPEGKKIYAGEYVLTCYREKGEYIFEILNGECDEFLKNVGLPPLPPYIKREPNEIDKKYYQSVFAKKEGSIAAPTASLHFTEELLKKIGKKGIKIRYINLRVGKGTFVPVKEKDIRKHRMEEEYYEIPEDTLSEIRRVRKESKRIFVCGTTCVRALETYGYTGKRSGFTSLFIYPPFNFKLTDALITNFHLPKSTPFLLVCAFVGRERALNLYEIAKRERYRFLSYGDAMLLIRRY